MSEYHLSVIATNGQVFDGKVESLSASGLSGSFGVLSQHAPMATVLSSGPLTIKQNGKDLYFAVSSGVLEVDNQSNCLLLANFATKAKSLEDAKKNIEGSMHDRK